MNYFQWLFGALAIIGSSVLAYLRIFKKMASTDNSELEVKVIPTVPSVSPQEPTTAPSVPEPTPTTTPVPVEPVLSPASSFPVLIVRWADAIAKWEGADPKLNNPGDLKFSTLTASLGGTQGKQASDGGWLCKFITPHAGLDALRHFLLLAAEDRLTSYHTARTLQAFSKIYGGNPPQGYIDGIAKEMGVPTTVDIGTFLY